MGKRRGGDFALAAYRRTRPNFVWHPHCCSIETLAFVVLQYTISYYLYLTRWPNSGVLDARNALITLGHLELTGDTALLKLQQL